MENNELLEMVRSKAQGWLTDSYDEETRAEVRAMLDKEDPTDLIESFYKDLEFGTGGLRGIMGADLCSIIPVGFVSIVFFWIMGRCQNNTALATQLADSV